MKTSYQIKNFTAEVVASSVPRVVEGYASAFGNIDSDNDIIEKGAFLKTISERGPDSANRIKYLYNHNPESVLGPIISLSEDSKGLHYKAKISETSYGNDVYQLIRDGALTEHSIGFQTVRQQKDDKGINHINELKLWELSTVIWGSNDDTPFTSIKSVGQIYDDLEMIDKSIRKGKFNDLSLLLIKIKQLQQQIVELTPVEEVESEESTEAVDASKEAVEMLKLFKENLTFLKK